MLVDYITTALIGLYAIDVYLTLAVIVRCDPGPDQCDGPHASHWLPTHKLCAGEDDDHPPHRLALPR